MRFPRVSCILIFLASVVSQVFAQNNLNQERDRAKMILKIVSQDIEKNYFDPAMGGLDWKKATDESRARIDNAQNIGQVYTAIFALPDRLHNSHTLFIPPQRTVRPYFGFEA